MASRTTKGPPTGRAMQRYPRRPEHTGPQDLVRMWSAGTGWPCEAKHFVGMLLFQIYQLVQVSQSLAVEWNLMKTKLIVSSASSGSPERATRSIVRCREQGTDEKGKKRHAACCRSLIPLAPFSPLTQRRHSCTAYQGSCDLVANLY